MSPIGSSREGFALISAGEASGDMHAAELAREFGRRHPDLRLCGITGPAMEAAGCQALHAMSEVNVMGISDVLANLGRIRRIENSILNWCAEYRPRVAMLVDFSAFHMRLGRKLRAIGIPVLHYIAPKLWAWGSWRVRKLRQSQDALACILPFEPDWFAAHGIRARYVGNPSAHACREGWDRDEFRRRLGLTADQKVLAVLPGSRRQELSAHLDILAEVVELLRSADPGLVVVTPVAPGLRERELQPLWRAGARAIERRHPHYALRADAAIAVSGTATLELGLWGVPTVLVYRSSPLTMFLARRLVKLNCAGLANIILDDQPVMPELIQEQCTSDNILRHIRPLLAGEPPAAAQRRALAGLWQRLGDANPALGCMDLVDHLLRDSGSENSEKRGLDGA